MNLKELKEVLKDRDYPEQLIDRGIEKARKIPRNAALLKVKTKEKIKRPLNMTLDSLPFPIL